MAHKKVIKYDQKYGTPHALIKFTRFELPDLKAVGKDMEIAVCESLNESGDLCDVKCVISKDGTHKFEFIVK